MATKSDFRLVYSTDPELNKKCTKCKELVSECLCRPEENAEGFKGPVILSMEKQGRGGKTVTLIKGFPRNEEYLKKMTATLKKKCGTGGTYLLEGKTGVIEIQGEKREQLRGFLEKEKILVKG